MERKLAEEDDEAVFLGLSLTTLIPVAFALIIVPLLIICLAKYIQANFANANTFSQTLKKPT
jgi:hypothetical protein